MSLKNQDCLGLGKPEYMWKTYFESVDPRSGTGIM